MTFHFGELVLDSDRRELRLGTELFAVEPQVFDLLEFLIRNRQRVVSRDDLLAAIWGGRIVSESAIAARINATRRAIGDNGKEQRWIRTVARKGFRFVGEVRESTAPVRPAPARQATQPAGGQRITFCRTPDGVNLAMARVGRGMPLVCIPTWGHHLEHDWKNPTGAEFLRFLTERFDVIRYDGRGFGLSDRDIGKVSLATLQRDLETVVAASGIDRYAVLCGSVACMTAVPHAAGHPDRVAKLIVHGGIVQGAHRWWTAASTRLLRAYAASVSHDWDKAEVALTLLRTKVIEAFPSLSPAQIEWCVNGISTTTSFQNALAHLAVYAGIDVAGRLAEVRAPTLVLHCRHSRALPFEQTHRIAMSIPNARLVSLESANAVPLPGEPAWPVLLDAVETFLSGA